MTAEASSAPEGGSPERRIPELDGVRGLMAILVVVSHYFGELEHGLRGAMFGWIAVDMFFVLSGFLIGKLILDKQHHANFFSVFYVRRFARILPAYVLTVLAVALILGIVPAAWADADHPFPLWTYLAFVQPLWMAGTQGIGAHWLGPTWTLAVEEHFYLVAPAAIVFLPRRWLVPALLAAGAAAVALRAAVFFGGLANPMWALVLLPWRADILVCGLLAAVAVRSGKVHWARWMPALRVAPIVCLLTALGLDLVDDRAFQVFSPLLVSMGCAAFLLGIVNGAPEARRFRPAWIRTLGDNAYCLYLTHLPVLGLMHGLILGSKPDLATPQQWVVTLAAIPVCLVVGFGLTKLIEEPFTRWGRTWRWSAETRAPDGVAQAA